MKIITEVRQRHDKSMIVIYNQDDIDAASVGSMVDPIGSVTVDNEMVKLWQMGLEAINESILRATTQVQTDLAQKRAQT